MIPKLAKWQLVAFLVIAVVAIAYAGATYARLDKLFGIGTYTVYADFKDSGGIFTNAEVTYLGTPIGRVSSLTLKQDGVRVALEMNSGDSKVPASAQAVVANRSAIGEQYVDLRPATVGAPYLKEGSVITDTSIPVPVQEVVSSAVTLSESVPVNDLRTVVTELGKAFNNNGANLRSLLDSLANLAKSGNDYLPQAVSLIRNADTVLGTQAEQSDSILEWSRNLGLITTQLAISDPDVRRLLTTGQTTATQLSALLERSGGDITTVVRNLGKDVRNISSSFVTVPYILALLSPLSSGSYSPALGDGTIRFGANFETNNPPSCTLGYEGTQAILAEEKRKNPDFDINYDEFPFNKDARCAVAQGNPTTVRGAQNVKYADPNTPQPWDSIPKKDPDKLNLNPIASQLSALLGVVPK